MDFDIGWIAGLVEGEGCICKSKFGWKFSVCMCNYDTIKRLSDIINKKFECHTKVHGPYQGKNGRKPHYRLQMTGYTMVPILKSILVGLLEKRDNAESAIIFYERKEKLSYNYILSCIDSYR